MFSKLVVSALVAASVASAASSCSSSAYTITGTADAAIASCTSVTGNIIVSASAGDTVDLQSIASIDGDLTVDSVGSLISFSGTDVNEITGTFSLNNLTLLSTLSMASLTNVGTIDWTSLPALNSLTFTAGVNKADSVTISDTFLQSLDGIDLETVGTMNINNNNRLTTVNLNLKNLTENLSFQANGQKLAVTLDQLIWASNLTIANVTTFSAPSLQVVNGSARFDSNYFTEMSFPNMTKTSSGDISFINNADLTNLSFASLTDIGGGLTLVNNTAYSNVTGFAVLADVGGAVKLGGSFEAVEFPSLHNVVGTFTVSSTDDIQSDCDTLEENAPGSQGGNGNIQGKFTCTSNNANANNGSTDGTSSSGSSGSGNSSAAANLHVSSAVMGLSFVGLLAQLL